MSTAISYSEFRCSVSSRLTEEQEGDKFHPKHESDKKMAGRLRLIRQAPGQVSA